MTWRLFLDDERDPATTVDDPAWRRSSGYLRFVRNSDCERLGDWRIARSSPEALKVISSLGYPAFVSFDHDLGGEDTGMAVARYLVDLDMDYGLMPNVFAYEVHSMNPIGRKRIDDYLVSWLAEKSRRRYNDKNSNQGVK